jgi:histone-binding protein RBBP4
MAAVGEEVDLDAQIEEEYKVWKKNSPFLYDCVVTQDLDWYLHPHTDILRLRLNIFSCKCRLLQHRPSLTMQWFPDSKSEPGKNYSVQRLLLGTNTSGAEQGDYLLVLFFFSFSWSFFSCFLSFCAIPITMVLRTMQFFFTPDYLMIAEIQLPNEDTDVDARNFEENGEVGGFGHGGAKISITHKFPVEAEVNRARYMPQVYSSRDWILQQQYRSQSLTCISYALVGCLSVNRIPTFWRATRPTQTF